MRCDAFAFAFAFASATRRLLARKQKRAIEWTNDAHSQARQERGQVSPISTSITYSDNNMRRDVV